MSDLSIPALAATSDLGLTLKQDQMDALELQRKKNDMGLDDPLTAVIALFGPQKPKSPLG